MTGRKETVPDAERRRATSAALKDSIEEVCWHYAPSGSRVENCWEVRGGTGAVTLRVFLAGPMQGSWTDTATGARGDALDLVAHLRSLDAAGALAEAERFLDRNAPGPEPKAGDAGGGQMALFGALPEDRGRKRPARRSARRRKAGASRQAEEEEGREQPAGGEPESCGAATGGSPASPETPAPRDGRTEPAPPDSAQDARTGSGKSGPPAADPDGVGFTADDRQRLRKSAEDSAWIRKHLTVRSLDAGAHERTKARREGHGRRWRRSGLKAAGIVALAAFVSVLSAMAEYRYGVVNFASVLGAERPGDTAVLVLDGDGG